MEVKWTLPRLAPVEHGMYRREVGPAERQASVYCMRIAKRR